MKKIIGISGFILLMISVAAYGKVTFSGSRTGNDSELIMDYSILNGTGSQELKLENGDVIEAK